MMQRAIITMGAIAAMCAVSAGLRADQPSGGALAGERYRVIVSSDIGGSDPDDFQSMVHYLVYADVFDTEGLISSPPHGGRAKHIHEVIDVYAKDYANLRRHSERYPSPGSVRAMTKQGEIEAWSEGGGGASEGSKWIIERAGAEDPRPLYILVWGSITDVAQAVKDDPSIKKKVRVYSIGSWNTRADRQARDYLFDEHPDLWWVESDTTFRGMYMGGKQDGDLGNRTFVEQHVKGHGALGDLFVEKKSDIKMGDTPSVLYLLRGDPADPAGEHWGGRYVRAHADERPHYWTDDPRDAWKDRGRAGAKTVNQWREAYLRDWQARMDRLLN